MKVTNNKFYCICRLQLSDFINVVRSFLTLKIRLLPLLQSLFVCIKCEEKVFFFLLLQTKFTTTKFNRFIRSNAAIFILAPLSKYFRMWHHLRQSDGVRHHSREEKQLHVHAIANRYQLEFFYRLRLRRWSIAIEAFRSNLLLFFFWKPQKICMNCGFSFR
jgi:hypothetical protein